MEIRRESVFISAIRSFLRAFFALCGIFAAFMIISGVYSAFSTTPLIEEKTYLNILPDANGKREMVNPAAPAILQINVHGPIGMDLKDLNSESFNNILIDSRSGLLSHDRVKGILLHINTPGGAAVDADDIYLMLKEYKERYQVPVFAFVDGLCASGGMYIASAADQIFASPSSAIGSVGVVYGPFFNVHTTLDKIGIEARTLTEGIDKDALNPTRAWKEGEDQWIKDLLAFMYNRFVTIVSEARPKLTKDQLVNVLGARMFDCVKAEQLGYIDHSMTNRNQALLALMEVAQIDPNHPYQVVELQPKKRWLSDLVSGGAGFLSGKIEHTFDLGQGRKRSPFAYLYRPE